MKSNNKLNRILFMVLMINIVLNTSCNRNNKNDTISLFPVSTENKFQYLDLEGKIVINPQFNDASIFRNGLALVQTTGDNPKWGFIDEDGKYVISAKYMRATIFSDDLAWVVSEEGAPTCINPKDEIQFTLQKAEIVNIFSEGLAGFKEVNEKSEEKWGFVDTKGKIKINAQFSEVGKFISGKCPVSNIDKKWGYIDKNGKIIINYQFDKAKLFYNGFAIVESGEKWGVIDESGKYLINPQYTNIYSDDNFFLIEQDGKYGWTDKEGKIIINPQFDNAYPFKNNDITAVKIGEKYGYIDKEGKIVINPQFDGATPFNGKLALVQSSNKIGFIDMEGKYVINPQYEKCSADLIEYIINGGSAFNSIETDVFIFDSIKAYTKIFASGEISINSTYSDILTKYNLESANFSQFSDGRAEFIELQETVDYFNVTLKVNGWAWKNVWSDDVFFDGFEKPYSIGYFIELKGKAINKKELIMKKIAKSFNGYSIIEKETSKTRIALENEFQKVYISLENDDFISVSLYEL